MGAFKGRCYWIQKSIDFVSKQQRVSEQIGVFSVCFILILCLLFLFHITLINLAILFNEFSNLAQTILLFPSFWVKVFVKHFLKEVSYAHQGCMHLIQSSLHIFVMLTLILVWKLWYIFQDSLISRTFKRMVLIWYLYCKYENNKSNTFCNNANIFTITFFVNLMHLCEVYLSIIVNMPFNMLF